MTLLSYRPNAVRALLSGLLALLLVLPGIAQFRQEPLADPDQLLPYGQRTDAFRRLLFEFHFKPVKSFAELQAESNKSVLIVLGDPSCLTQGYFQRKLRPFIEEGGAVMVATDKATEGEAGENLLESAGVIVTGETLVAQPFDPNRFYLTSTYCPFVRPITASVWLGISVNPLDTLADIIGAGQRPALFRNPHPDQDDLHVATNAPSRLEVPRSRRLPAGIHRLAQLPPCRDANRTLGGTGSNSGQYKAPLFAVGGVIGKGRVLVLADHSIFINRMILARDNGNLEFAANCLHWLRGGVASIPEAMKAAHGPRGIQELAGERDKLLFWDDGRVRANFEVPLKSVPITPPWGAEPAIVAAVDQALARAEDQNSFNRHLLEELLDRNWTMTRMGRYALYLLTFALLLLLGYRFVWRERYRLDLAVPRLARVVAQHEPRSSLLEQRRWAMLRAGNVWETAHQSARLCFQSAGIPLTGMTPPRISTEGGWWRRWRVARRVGRLWELARGTTPGRIPPAALKRWLRDLDELQTALAKGTLRFSKDEGGRMKDE